MDGDGEVRMSSGKHVWENAIFMDNILQSGHIPSSFWDDGPSVGKMGELPPIAWHISCGKKDD